MAQLALPPASVGPAVQDWLAVPVPRVSVSVRPPMGVIPSSSKRAPSVTGWPWRITVGPVNRVAVSSRVTMNGWLTAAAR